MIGVFDSGFGGFTVLKELLKKYPEYDYLYLGDQARIPYGTRSQTTIQKFTEKGINFLWDKGAKLILIACNSATANALKYLQSIYPKKHILGVIIPAAETALKKTRFGNIGVVGTSATIKSNVYEIELKKAEKTFYKPCHKKALSSISVYQKAMPLLVPLIEEDWAKKPETRMIMRKYLRSLKDKHVDTLILGCTHYPILEKTFQKIMGKNCVIISPSLNQAESLGKYLQNHPDVEKTLSKKKKRVFFTTDCPEKFTSLGSLFLGQKIEGKKAEI